MSTVEKENLNVQSVESQNNTTNFQNRNINNRHGGTSRNTYYYHNRPNRGRFQGNYRHSHYQFHPNSRSFENRTDHGGIKMTGKVMDCHICCQSSDLFGIGTCQHPVCMECCIRMRVFGESKSCPQCRADIEMLYFVSVPSDEHIKLPTVTMTYPDSAKHGIRFENQYAINCYESYLAFTCKICAKKGEKIEFPNFQSLKHHCGQVHNVSYCHICIEHLNILPKNRATYSKDELSKHMNGELNEYGFKGHPNCNFCIQRFLDDEHLWKHKRREHFYCDLCHADGKNDFYKYQNQLHAHYSKFHVICKEPDCIKAGIVFREEIELDVHKAKEHGEKRLTNLEFNYTRGPRRFNDGASSSSDIRSTPRVGIIPSNDNLPLPSADRNVVIIPSSQNRAQNLIRRSNFNAQTNEFPLLEPTRPIETNSIKTNFKKPLAINSGEHFPSLSSDGSSSRTSTASNSVWGKGNTAQLFKNQPVYQPQASRKKFVPSPDVWPENMREIIEARMKGLPEPVLEKEPIKQIENEIEPKKNKKKKAKTIPASSVSNTNVVESISSGSKFETLSEWDEMVEPNMPNLKNNKIYKKTDDNFVQILNDRPVTLRSIASIIANTDSSKERTSIEKEVPNNWENEISAIPPVEVQIPEKMTPSKNFSPMSNLIANVFSFPSRLFSGSSSSSTNEQPKSPDKLEEEENEQSDIAQLENQVKPSLHPPGFDSGLLLQQCSSSISPPPGFESSVPPGFNK